MRVTRILFVLLLLSFVAATLISVVLSHVMAQETGSVLEGDVDVVELLSLVVRVLVMTGLAAPVVFLNCWKWVRETGLFRFLSFVSVPLLMVGWVSLFFRDRPDWDILLMSSTVFFGAQVAAYLWFSSVVRGNG